MYILRIIYTMCATCTLFLFAVHAVHRTCKPGYILEVHCARSYSKAIGFVAEAATAAYNLHFKICNLTIEDKREREPHA
jgi:hypothetical protein